MLTPMTTGSADGLERRSNAVMEVGRRLADSPRWSKMCEGLEDDRDRSFTALYLQNQLDFMASNRPQIEVVSEGLNRLLEAEGIQETTRIVNIGNFDKFAFPIIRAVYPNLIANDIVSVQPMAGPVSLVFYLDYLMGTTKGNQTSGDTFFDARTGPTNSQFYSSTIVPNENLGADDGAETEYSQVLAHIPVRPGTLSGSYESGAGIQTFTDDGNGGLIGSDITAADSRIDYNTGVIRISSSGTAVVPVIVTYEYDTEANTDIPQIDLQLTSAPVVALVRKLRSRWSLEAAQNLNALHGIDAEAELVGVMAEVIKLEIDREVINDLFNFAQAGNVQWDKAVPAGISYTEHKLSFVDALIQNSNQVFTATKRGQTNWMVCGVDVCNVIESLPTFSPDSGALSTQSNTGVVKIGTLNNRWTVYKDPFFPSSKWVTGFKGGSFLDAGYVYSPYIPLYSTPTVILDDFMGRKGIGTQYGKKAINSNFYATGQVLNV